MGICSWNYHLTGDGHRAELRTAWLTERGTIEADGRAMTVVKHGPVSGTWTLEGQDRILYTARKPNPLTRAFSIVAEDGSIAELRACSAFSRRMMLHAPEIDFRIEPAHPFTRRASITGRCLDFPLVCFAFWLTVIIWRRAAGANGSGSGA